MSAVEPVDAARGTYSIEGVTVPWSDWRRTAQLVRHLTRRNLMARYRGSSLGFVWSLLNPILMMGVYTFVFQYVFRIAPPGVPYPVFFLTGIMAWNFLHISTMNSAISILDNLSLINKAYFPRYSLPLAAVLANFTNYIVSVPILLGFNLIFGILPGGSLLLLPLAMLQLLLLAVALSLIISCLTPFFRDLVQLLEMFFVAWFFASPVLYPATLPQQNLPTAVFGLYQLNPFVGTVSLVRVVFLGEPILIGAVVSAGVVTLLLLGVGILLFRKLSPKFDTAV